MKKPKKTDSHKASVDNTSMASLTGMKLQQAEEGNYWKIVHSDRGDLNGRVVRPIDMPYRIGGMLVFTSDAQALMAAQEIHRLYGIVCRPVLLGQESR